MRRLVAALGFLIVGAAQADVPERQIQQAIGARPMTGTASWYGPGFDKRLMANGQRFDKLGRTAAHRTLPFGTKVRVINPRNWRAETVTITDRGPFIRGRDIDLSQGTARRLGLERQGLGQVYLEVLR